MSSNCATNIQAEEMNTAGPSDFIVVAMGQKNRDISFRIPNSSHPSNISGSETMLRESEIKQYSLNLVCFYLLKMPRLEETNKITDVMARLTGMW